MIKQKLKPIHQYTVIIRKTARCVFIGRYYNYSQLVDKIKKPELYLVTKRVVWCTVTPREKMYKHLLRKRGK